MGAFGRRAGDTAVRRAGTAHRTRARHAAWRVPAVLTAAALAAASPAALGAPAGAASSGAAGKLSIEAPGVTVLKKGATTFKKAKANQRVKTGDTVQTDGTGLAQITFEDGSLTRLDHGTVFTLEKLVSKTGQRQVEGTVSAGQTWNRVQKLSGEDTFAQSGGNGATAAVLGTAFLTKCSLPSGVAFKVVKTKKALKKLRKSTTCRFTLVDGKLQLSSLGKVVGVARGQSVTVDPSGTPGEVQTEPPDILFTNAWITKNLDADARAGVAEATGQPSTDDLAQARIEGAWPVTLTVTGTNGFRDLTGGATRNRTYSFAGTCTAGSCSVTLTRETANGSRVIPLAYSNGVYTGTDPDMGTQDCVLDDGRVSVAGGLRNSGTITFTPGSAVPQDGLWRATSLSGTVTESAEQIAGAPGQCRTGTATFSLAASR